MNWTHLIAALIAVGWAVSVEYRLWANLRILSDHLRPRRTATGGLHAVEK